MITGRPATEPSYETMQRTGRMVGLAVASMCNFFDLNLLRVIQKEIYPDKNLWNV
jgi:glucokinase